MCSQKLEAKPIRKTAEYKRKVSKIVRGKILKVGGADGIRTHDLLDAIEARSQLRHGPTEGMSKVYHTRIEMSLPSHVAFTLRTTSTRNFRVAGHGVARGVRVRHKLPINRRGNV